MMKFFFPLLLTHGLAIHGNAQTKAISDQGREVTLFDNGTWKYSHDSTSANAPDSLQLNPVSFAKSADAGFLVKSTTFNVGVSINPADWTYTGRHENEKNPEYHFSAKTIDGYAMLITETVGVDLVSLKRAALSNARSASFDIQETYADYRMVNGIKVVCLEMKGTVSGIQLAYLGYYCSNENGTVQLLAYCSLQQYEKMKPALTQFLNGLTEIKKTSDP